MSPSHHLLLSVSVYIHTHVAQHEEGAKGHHLKAPIFISQVSHRNATNRASASLHSLTWEEAFLPWVVINSVDLGYSPHVSSFMTVQAPQLVCGWTVSQVCLFRGGGAGSRCWL